MPVWTCSLVFKCRYDCFHQRPGGKAEVTGTIAESGKDIVIQADNGDEYTVMGKDLKAMVGKKVTAKGTLAEADGKKTITVISVQPAE